MGACCYLSCLWDDYFGRPYAHGTMFRRALEEGVVDPSRMTQGGRRGPLCGVDDEQIPDTLGVESIAWVDLLQLGPESICLGTGTPEVGGPISFQAMRLLRTLTGINSVGYDVVEVAPQYDGVRSPHCSPRTRCSRC